VLSDLQAIDRLLRLADCPEAMFGPGPMTAEDVKRVYHSLVKVAHPDRYVSDLEAQSLAQVVFTGLTTWYSAALAKIAAGTYGDRTPFVAQPVHAETHVIKAPKRQYVVSERIGHDGDLADVYRCVYSEGHTDKAAAFKIARSPADNDLLENESKILSTLYPESQAKEGYYRLLPKLCDSFVLQGNGIRRRVNILSLAEGYVSIADVKRAYPNGLDYRDAAWMFKRVLMVLGFVHRSGLVHGAVLTAHVLVHPIRHGAKLIDWCYAVQSGQRIRALSKPEKHLYAPEVAKKEPALPQTDIYMLAATMKTLIGPSCPEHLQVFLSTCLFANPNRRPHDAWTLHEEFDELLFRLVGKPAYRPLTMPIGV
jgi:serine/threonine protein kinase